MLLSAVFVLRPGQEAVIPLTTGNAVHAAFLDLIRQVDLTLAKRLHSPGRDKPFTVSPLYGTMERQGNSLVLQAGQEYWLRFTSLDPVLSQLLLALGSDGVGRISLFEVEFAVLKACLEAKAHPWAGQTTYEVLYDTWLGSPKPPSRKIRLRFVSPTTFRSGKQNLPFPLAHLVFFSLGEKWRQYAPPSLGNEISRFLDELVSRTSATTGGGPWVHLNEIISLARYDLRTQVLNFGHYKQVGFAGEAEFLISEKAKDSWARLLHLLTDFAFYAGVGYKTTMGMGQVMALLAADSAR